MLLFALTGCLTLDFLFFGAPTVDAYEIDNELVPTEQIEIVTFPSTDGTTLYGAWAHQDDPDAPVLVFLHGKSSTIASSWPRIDLYWDWGFRVFTMDYRGYGRSDGEQDGSSILEEDGLAGLQYVLDTTGLTADQVFVHGLSLGGAVALHTADELSPRALVVESVFASTELMLDSSSQLDLPAAWFVEDDVDNVVAIGQIHCPVLVIHGLADDFVDPRSGQLLYDAAPEPRQLWQPEGVGHADLHEVLPDQARERLLEFYDGP